MRHIHISVSLVSITYHIFGIAIDNAAIGNDWYIGKITTNTVTSNS